MPNRSHRFSAYHVDARRGSLGRRKWRARSGIFAAATKPDARQLLVAVLEAREAAGAVVQVATADGFTPVDRAVRGVARIHPLRDVADHVEDAGRKTLAPRVRSNGRDA